MAKMDIKLFPKNVKIKTTASVNCGYLGYDANVRLKSVGAIINNTTKTYSDVATDGTHIWLKANNKTTVSYNGATPTFTRASNVFMITIPGDYDPTIPFVF